MKQPPTINHFTGGSTTRKPTLDSFVSNTMRVIAAGSPFHSTNCAIRQSNHQSPVTMKVIQQQSFFFFFFSFYDSVRIVFSIVCGSGNFWRIFRVSCSNSYSTRWLLLALTSANWMPNRAASCSPNCLVTFLSLSRSLLLPTSMIYTSLTPLSRICSIQFSMCWNDEKLSMLYVSTIPWAFL